MAAFHIQARWALLFLSFIAAVPSARAEIALKPVNSLQALDFPNDAGDAILLTWSARPEESAQAIWKVAVATSAQGPWAEILSFPQNSHYAMDIELPFWLWRKVQSRHALKLVFNDKVKNALKIEHNQLNRIFYFRLSEKFILGHMESAVISAAPAPNWFNTSRLFHLAYLLVFTGLLLAFIGRARKGGLFLRRISGLSAIDQAVDRAAETGRPVFFLPGRLGITNISTIAATFILGEIAKRAAALGARIKVPHIDPLVMAVCQETVENAYWEAGRRDDYQEEINFYLTDDQFAYTAALNGMMVREKPAAVFYAGYYHAESLLLAEVGAETGALQIAATDAELQLPFFFMTCDHTLIGEELYAAGAYLSRDPVLFGTLRGQDAGKLFIIGVILLSLAASLAAAFFHAPGPIRALLDLFHAY